MIGADHAAATPTREAVLAQLLREADRTASQLASRLEVSVQVMRRHLRSLEEDGLVEASPAQAGPGRPTNRWRLTESGRARFPDGSEQFALGLLQSLAASMPADSLQLLLRRQALEKAEEYRRQIGNGPLPHRLGQLVELRRREGYLAECRRESKEETRPDSLPSAEAADAWLLSEFHCSVMRIAQEFPVLCDQELQLLRHTFPDCRVERVHWRLEKGHSCGFRISPLSSPPPRKRAHGLEQPSC
jgi:DeoR family suf operon transcriptional repressor